MMGNTPLGVILWSGIGFLSGSAMFSYWLGKLILRRDVREYGDANPGAVNAWKAGGWKIGLPGALLDFCKGAVPVGLAVWTAGVGGWGLVPVALAPVLGHAFSPFLGFKGGKAVAVTLGVWSGVTIWEGLGVLAASMGLFYLVLDNDSWTVVLAVCAYGVYLLLRHVGAPMLVALAGNLAVLLNRHWSVLREGLKTRSYIQRLFRRAG
jgi:glycerol-3-phosphate acyltransferase PlsY